MSTMCPLSSTERTRPTTEASYESRWKLAILAISLMVFTSRVDATECGGELTGSYGVVVSPGYPQAYPADRRCEWHIAPNTTGGNSTENRGLTLTFRRFQTKADEYLFLYTSDPNADPPPSYFQRFSGKLSTGTRVAITSSNQVWLKFQSSSTQNPPGSEILGFRILYLAHGADVQCESNPLQNGRIKDATNGSAALDSTVEFQCDRGFRMDGSHFGSCTLTGTGPDPVSPQWSNVPKCVPTCVAPPGINNGSYVKSSNSLNVNATVTYSCDLPFRLSGSSSVITCILNVTGTPHWDRPSPTCSIPNCQNSMSFTDFSGALVNPSFPRHFVAGGTNCDWKIQVEVGKVVNFNISYFDLPVGGQLTFRDGNTKRLIQILYGDQDSDPQRSFNSTDRSVEVIYNSATSNSSQHRGFHVGYTTVVPSGRPVIPTATNPSVTLTRVMTSEYSSGPSSVRAPITESNDDDHGMGGKIAAGVIVPILLISLTLAVVYMCYRKKYPVRMIMGRDFAKFSNPAYSRSQDNKMHTLVREDAEEFFQQTQPTGNVTLVLGDGDEEANATYVNVAFQYDSHDVDEEEVEKRFRQQKAYLFKKDEDEVEAPGKSEVDKARGVKDKKKDRPKVNGQAGRYQGHDNAAFSGDSDIDDVDEKDTGKKDQDEPEGASTDVSSDSDKENKPMSQQNGSSQETAVPSPQDLSDERQNSQPSMTVRDFLLLAKDKRAMSDAITRARADSLTLNFDSKKSARRRAQSAENIWSRVTPSSLLVSREEVKLNTSGATPTDISTTLQADTYAAHGTYENLNIDAEGGTSTENVHEVTQPVLKSGQVETTGMENSVTNSYENVEGAPISDSSDKLIPDKEDDSNNEHKRTSSSSSCSSYEEMVQFPIHPVSSNASIQSLRGNDSDSSSLKQDLGAMAGSANSSTLPEDDYVNVPDMAHLRYNDTNTPMESPAQNGTESSNRHESVDDAFSEEPVNLDGVQGTTDTDDQSTSLQTPVPDSVSLTEDHNVRSVEPPEQCQDDSQSSIGGADNAEDFSPSSSLVVQFDDDIDDFDIKDDDHDEGSFKSDESSGGDRGSAEEKAIDGESFEHIEESQQEGEQEGEWHLSGQQWSAEPQRKPISVQMLPGLTYSDQSSASSSSSESKISRNDEFAEASQGMEPRPLQLEAQSLDLLAKSDNEGRIPHSQEMSSADHDCSTSEPASVQLMSLSPQPSQPHGLAALKLHPNVESRLSESDSNVDLTDEDIQKALEERSDDSSDDGHLGVPAHQQTDAGKVPIKIEPTEMFVFSEEDDNEDIDV